MGRNPAMAVAVCKPQARAKSLGIFREAWVSRARPIRMTLPDLSTASLAVLLEQAASGNAHALGEIHDRFYTRLYRYALIRLGDEAVAEDVASEVFLRLLATLRDKRPPHSNLRGWLFGTASHVVADHIRRAPRQRARISDEQRAEVSTEVEAEERLLFASIRAAMRRLTRDQEQVLALRFGSGYSLEETAEIMGKSIGAVKVLQFRATVALREVMSRIEYE